MSSPRTSGVLGSTQAVKRTSLCRAPMVTHTCLAGMGTFLVSRRPVHRSRFSRLMSLFPRPPLVFHSLTMSLMNSIFLRNWFAAGMPWSSARISGRQRGLLALRVPTRMVGCFAGVEKFKRVWRGTKAPFGRQEQTRSWIRSPQVAWRHREEDAKSGTKLLSSQARSWYDRES